MSPTGASDADGDALLAALATGLGKSSYPASQSQELLTRVARAYGHPVNLTVLSTVSLIGDPSTGRVTLQSIAGGYRFDQIAAVQEQLSRALVAAAPAGEIVTALQQIDRASPPRPAWLRVVGYGIAAVGFGAALRISPTLLVIALALGLVVGLALVLVKPKSLAGILLPILATFGAALAVGAITAITGLDDPVRLAVIPVVYLLPGAAITAAVIELVNGDMLAGSSRLVYAVMQLAAMGFAFALAIDIAGVPTTKLIDLSAAASPAWVAWLGALGFAAGLALYACTPRRLWLSTLVLAIVAFTVQQVAATWLAPPLAGGVAAALVLLGAYALNARNGSGPSTIVLFIPAFWLIVPGSVGFTAIAGAIVGDGSLSSLGSQAAFTFLSMAIGVMIASLIWAWGRERFRLP